MKVSPVFACRFSVSLSTSLGLLFSALASAHTTSVGYENSGPGSVTFWYGTYHAGTSFTEGSMQVTGPDAYSETVSFSLLVDTKPTGLVDGVTNFYSDGTQLVGTYGGTIYAWQGSTFTNLNPGVYTFTYIPIATPTAVWDPIDAVILSSSVTLDEAVIGSPPASFVDNATANSSAAAQVLDELQGDSSGGMTAAIAVLSSLSPTDQTAALQRIAPVTNRAEGVAATRAVTSVMDTVQTRLDSVRTRGFRSARADGQGSNKMMVASVADLAGLFRNESQARGVWGKVFGGHSEQNLKDGFAGYDADTWGASVGADTQLQNNWVVGAAVAYASTDVDLEDFRTGDGSDITTYQLTGYGARDFGKWYVESILAYAVHDYKKSRYTGIAGIANAEYDGDQWAARVNLGLPIPLERKVTVTPIAGLEWTHLGLESYIEENAGALSLDVNRRSAERIRSSIGARMAAELELQNGTTLLPSLQATWRHDFKNDGIDTTANFAGGGTSFTTPGQDVARNAYGVGGAVTWHKTENLSVSVQLEAEWSSGYRATAGQLLGQWRFQ